MAEAIEFRHNNKNFTIVSGGKNARDKVYVDKGEGFKRCFTILGISKLRKPSETEQAQVCVEFQEELVTLEGVVIPGTQKKPIEFNTVGTQESYDYFYDYSRNGDQIAKAEHHGFLIHAFDVAIYDAAGNFFQPIWFDTAINHYALPEPTVEIPNPILTGKITVNVIDGANDGYTYKLVGTNYPAQSSNVFDNIPAGEYKVLVTSPLSMPCIRTVQL